MAKKSLIEDRQEKVFNAVIVFGIILLVLFFVRISSYMNSNTNGVSEVSVEKLYACSEDYDCTLINSDCCNCELGGTKIAINKKYVDYWNNKIRGKCSNESCRPVQYLDISCSSEAKCINNICQVQSFI